MKKFLFSMLAVIPILSLSTAKAAELPPRVDKPVAVSDAYVPGGFDSTSDAYVVVSGIFPNSCYLWKEAKMDLDRSTNTIDIQSYASVGQGICLMVLVPYHKEVSLGQLDAGDYTLRFQSGDGTYFERELHIEE